MKKNIVPFLVGVAISVLILLPLLRYERQLSWELGRKSGIIQGHFDVADVLQKEFGVFDGKDSYKELFSVKSTSIVSVETNGVKTVRVAP
jgi:hypothetical protein